MAYRLVAEAFGYPLDQIKALTVRERSFWTESAMHSTDLKLRRMMYA